MGGASAARGLLVLKFKAAYFTEASAGWAGARLNLGQGCQAGPRPPAPTCTSPHLGPCALALAVGPISCRDGLPPSAWQWLSGQVSG